MGTLFTHGFRRDRRMPGVAPLDRCIRVTVGSVDERRRFGEILRQVLPRVRQPGGTR